MDIEVRGARPDEMNAVLDFTDMMGAPREYFAARYRGFPGARSEHSRIVVWGGRIVSHIRVFERRIRFGRAFIDCGAIGDVITHPDHRRKGYGLRLLNDATAYFRERNIPLCMIHSGVFGFYSKGGWSRYPEPQWSVDVKAYDDDGPNAEDDFTVRRFERGNDLDRIMEIYRADTADRTLALERTDEYWRNHFHWMGREREDMFLVLEKKGQIVAYVRSCPPLIKECICLPEAKEGTRLLLRRLLRTMSKADISELAIGVPEDHPWTPIFRAASWAKDSGRENLLLKVIDFRELVRRMIPGLKARLESADFRGNCAFGLNVREDMVPLTINGRDIQLSDAPREPAIDLTEEEFLFLFIGMGDPEKLAGIPGAPEMGDILFRGKSAFFYRTDTV